MIATTLLAGCASPPVNTSLLQAGRPQTMRQVMECKDKLVFLSAGPVNRARPVLVLLHGATSDPTEMLQIFTEYQNQYNVFLYSFNFHQPVKKVAGDLVGELQALKSEIESAPPRNLPVGDVTVVDYSYSAIVFRMAVILANDPALFSNVSLIQLVPIAGGSSLARSMWFPGLNALVSLASQSSGAADPRGRLAKEIWEGEGNRRFYAAINPDRMISIIMEDDPHSVAAMQDPQIRQRYRNGIGPNVIVIPKSMNVRHAYFPTEPACLDYLKKALAWSRKQANATDPSGANPSAARRHRTASP